MVAEGKLSKMMLFISTCIIFFLNSTSSDITCYHCLNKTIESCGNETLQCRSPADSCYITMSMDKTMISKSCLRQGHCSPQFLCNGITSCDLYCCQGEDFCNKRNFHERWMLDMVPINLFLTLFIVLMLIKMNFTTPPQ